MRSFRPDVECANRHSSAFSAPHASWRSVIAIGVVLVAGCTAAEDGHAAERIVSPSGGNDTLAVRTAIIGSSLGDVLVFSKGLFRLSGVMLKSGVVYKGDGAILSATNAGPIFTVDPNDSHDITIDSFCFVGNGANPMSGAIKLVGNGAPNSVSNIRILNSTLRNNGLTFNFLKHSEISGNRFENIGVGGAGVYGYHLDNTSIERNAFISVYQGMSIILGGVPNQGRNIVVADNIGRGISRMGIEIQGSSPPEAGESQNLLVERNRFSTWINPVADGNTIAYSIVTDGGDGIEVRDNYAQTKLKTGIGIEIAGSHAVAERNYIDGFDAGIIAYTAGDIIRNNTVVNTARHPTSAFGRNDILISSNSPSEVENPAPLGVDDPGDRRCTVGRFDHQ